VPGIIALAVKRETTAALDWMAAGLHMGSRSTVSREMGALAKVLQQDKKRMRLQQPLLDADV